MKEDLISIIIPMYNVEDYVSECLSSILNQTYKNIEIIVVDDGSNDESAKIVKKISKKDSRIKYKFQCNSGVSHARNQGIRLSKGRWISFVDPDDILEENAIEFLLESNSLKNIDIVIGDFSYLKDKKIITVENYDRNCIFDKENIKEIQLQLFSKRISALKGNIGDRIGAPWAKLYKRSFLIENNLFFEKCLFNSEDIYFNLLALEFAENVSYINKPVYIYRLNEESLTKKISPEIITQVLLFINMTKLFVEKYHFKDKRFLSAFNIKVISSIFKVIYMYYFHPNNNDSYHKNKIGLITLLHNEVISDAMKKASFNLMTLEEQMFYILLKFKAFRTIKFLTKVRQIIK